ncbi:MAG: hypothetical protein ACSNEK_02725 [Parachlamydiaceae bacterium]
MKKPKKKEKPESEKKFPQKKDDFDDLSEKACAGYTISDAFIGKAWE